MSDTPNDDTSLGVARAWVLSRIRDGVRCPLCKRYNKIYQRSFNSSMARCLIWLVLDNGNEWCDINGKGVPKLLVKNRDLPTMRFWKVVECTSTVHGRTLWRATKSGVRFVRNRSRIRKYGMFYHNRVLELTGEFITIKDALGDHFNYDDLMRR